MHHTPEDSPLHVDNYKQQVDKSVAYGLQNNVIGSSEVDAQVSKLRQELWITQASLTLLGVKRDTAPRYLPYMDVPVISYSPHKTSPPYPPYHISLIGMPKSLKTQLIMMRGFLQDKSHYFGFIPVLLGELAGPLKDEFDSRSPHHFDFVAYQSELVRRQMAQSDKALHLISSRSLEDKYYVLSDRDWTDLPMARANFIAGRYPAGFMTYLEWRFQDNLQRYSAQANLGIINALTSTKNSLRREGARDKHPHKPNRIMNPEFLGNLYAQYLRFHYETITTLTRTGEAPLYSYAAINTNSPATIFNSRNVEANSWRRFEKVLHALLTNNASWIPFRK